MPSESYCLDVFIWLQFSGIFIQLSDQFCRIWSVFRTGTQHSLYEIVLFHQHHPKCRREKWDGMLDNVHLWVSDHSRHWWFQHMFSTCTEENACSNSAFWSWNHTHLKAKFPGELLWKNSSSYIFPNLKVTKKKKEILHYL